MDNWKAWAVMFLSVCVMVVTLANLDYGDAAVVAVVIPFGLGIVCALLGFLSRGREIRHRERLAMIEKGIYIEAGQHASGVPSLAVILLVGIGLAAVIASDVEYLGYALLFVGIGLIVRSILLNQRKRDQESHRPVQPEEPEEPQGAGDGADSAKDVEDGTPSEKQEGA